MLRRAQRLGQPGVDRACGATPRAHCHDLAVAKQHQHRHAGATDVDGPGPQERLAVGPILR